MKKAVHFGLVFSVLALVMMAAAPLAADNTVDMTGTWELYVEASGQASYPVFEFTQEGNKLSGTCYGQMGSYPVNGKVKGEKFSFSMHAAGVDMKYSGKIVDGKKTKGNVDLGMHGMGTFTGEKK